MCVCVFLLHTIGEVSRWVFSPKRIRDVKEMHKTVDEKKIRLCPVEIRSSSKQPAVSVAICHL